jgi:hypothetical protein
MTVLLTSVSCLPGPKLRHFRADPIQVIAPHRLGMHYRRFEILLPLTILPSGSSNHNIRRAGNTAHSRRHRQHKTGLNCREILKLEVPPHHFMVRRL